MAIWDRNDNANRGNMGGRARNLADRAGEALRHGMDRTQHRGGYDHMDYNAGGRATGGWNGDSYGAGGYGGNAMGGNMGGNAMGGNNMGNMGGNNMGRPMGNEYDRDFTYRGTPGGNVNGGVGRDLGYGYGAGDRDEMGRGSMNYDRGFGMGGGGRMNNTGYGATGGAGMGYDRGYQGRNQTDNGDPFGDRQQHTPFRVMRGHDVNNMGHDQGGGFGGGRGMTGRGGYDSSFAFGAQGMERTDINRGDRGNRLSSDRLENRDEGYRAYQDYNGYSRGLNYEPYYNADDMSGGREVGEQNFYDTNYRNRRDRDWF
ncbi:MAG TPA: hypothetical protein VF613_14435 [Longimicrobium sp.]|jgi:hypothetical protein